MSKPRTVWVYGPRTALKATLTEPENPDCNVWFKALEVLPPSDDTAAMEAAADKYTREAFQNWKQAVLRTKNPTMAPHDEESIFKAGWLAKAAWDRGEG